MRRVIPLSYGTAFKKAFADPELFTAFVRDVLGLELTFTSVQQELGFHPPVGNIDVRFDLFGEDAEHRAIVELQHVRESDAFDRFHYYHLVAQLEQVRNAKDYTIVVLTRLPQEERLRFDVATQSSDFFTLEGRALQVLDHRIVMVNPRAISERTPAPVKRWLELIEDSLDEFVDENDYPEPALRKVLAAIESDAVTPAERYRFIQEAEWEKAKDEGVGKAHKEGLEEGERNSLVRTIPAVAAAFGLELTDARGAQLAAASVDELRALHERLLRDRRWE